MRCTLVFAESLHLIARTMGEYKQSKLKTGRRWTESMTIHYFYCNS
jgi:hypothetical protein